jgi:hypothetical protein
VVGPPKPPVDRYLIRLEVFEAWAHSVGRRNVGKVGAPFRYPPELFRFLAWIRTRAALDYRTLGELTDNLLDQAVRQLRAQHVPEDLLRSIKAPHFTQIRRRVEEVQVPASVRERLAAAGPQHILLDTNGVRILSPPEFERWIMRQTAGRGHASATRLLNDPTHAQFSNVASTASSAVSPPKS